MTTEKAPEELLKQVRLSTTAEQDERILGDALAALDESAADRGLSITRGMLVLGMIRWNRWTRYAAAAAAVILVTTIAWNLLPGNGKHVSVAQKGVSKHEPAQSGLSRGPAADDAAKLTRNESAPADQVAREPNAKALGPQAGAGLDNGGVRVGVSRGFGNSTPSGGSRTESGGVPTEGPGDAAGGFGTVARGVSKGTTAIPESSRTTQGRLQLGMLIPIRLKVDVPRQPKVVELPWIMFWKEKDQLRAALRVRMVSYPKGKWQTTVQLLDQDGRELKAATAVFENSGVIRGFAAVGEGNLNLTFGPASEVSAASRFRVKIAFAAEDAKITRESVAQQSPSKHEYSGTLQFEEIIPILLDAGRSRYGNTVELPWIRFQKQGDQIRAALRVVLISYPKSKWLATVQLLDKDGREIKAASAVFENSGIIAGFPIVEEGDVYFAFRPIDTLSAADRFRVMIQLAREDAKTTTGLTPLPQPPRAAKGNRSLEWSTVVTDGRPPQKATTTIWRKLDSIPDPGPLSVWSDRPIYWEIDGATYAVMRTIGGSSYSGGPSTIEDLPEGRYRVTVSSTEGPDCTPFGSSEPLDLTGDHTSQKTTIQLKGRYPLTVKVVHEHTGKPMPRERIVLRAPNGMPIAFRSFTGDDGVMHFRALPAGTYSLELGKQGWWNGKIKTVAAEVKAGDENKIVVSYAGSSPRRREYAQPHVDTPDQAHTPELHKMAEANNPRVVLPSGAEIELVALSRYPDKNQPFWRPDGRWLDQPPFDTTELDVTSFSDPKSNSQRKRHESLHHRTPLAVATVSWAPVSLAGSGSR